MTYECWLRGFKPGLAVLMITLGFGYLQCAAAQVAETTPVSTSSAADPGVLEEVIVTARRKERGGGGRNTAASRRELDRSDETSMEGFFDDIAGLSTLGDDGQGNPFSINGLSASLSNITMNGQGFGEGRGSGGFGAGDLPPDMIRRVNIYKIPTASMEEGGAGGSVNLELRNPVDITGSSMDFKGRLGHTPSEGTFSPSASYFTGRARQDKRFGYMLSLTTSQTEKLYPEQNISNWILEDFDGTSAYIPSQVKNSENMDVSDRYFAGLTLGFRPHPSIDIGARVFLSQKIRDRQSQSLQHRVEKQRYISMLAFDGRIASELESSDRSRKNLRILAGARKERTDSLLLGLDLNWRLKGWRIGGSLGYTVDDSIYDLSSREATFEVNSAFAYYVRNDGSLIMDYSDGFPQTEDFEASQIKLTDKETRDTNSFAALDVTRQQRQGFFNRIRFGGKLRESTRDRQSSKGRLKFDDDLDLLDYFSGQYQQTPWDLEAWPGADIALINALLRESEIEWQENLLNDYDVERHSMSGYIQVDFRTSETNKRFLVGNIGIRMVDTRNWIDGYQAESDALKPVSIKTDYTDYLPSTSTRIRIARRAVLTLGAARVMTQPSFNDLAPGIRFNQGDKTARAGNPYLEPFRAGQYLAELAWAVGRGGRLGVSTTYRDVESYIALDVESYEFEDESYLLTRPVNDEDGYIFSVGINLEQDLRRLSRRLRDFTVSLSYTRNKSSTRARDPFSGESLPMPDTAAHTARADLVYSNERLTGKLSYQWRGESLKASVSKSGLSVWSQPVGNLNFGIGWRLNDTLQLSFDGRNLLNEEQILTTDYEGQLWRITERYRSVAIVFRAKW